MSYIGRNIENLASRTKLDSISTSATATFNLLLSGVAYVPSSAESLTVSLNGIIQSPQSSYTVSGSTIVFASNLASSDVIDFILAERAITLTTIGSGTVTTSNIVDGNVTNAKLANSAITLNGSAVSLGGSATISSGITMADMWRQSANGSSDINANTVTTLTANWEQVDTDGFGGIGTAMSQSSGTFTFPTTGIYLITYNIQLYSPSQGATFAGGFIDVTTDNSSYSQASNGYNSIYHSNGYGIVTLFHQFDVTNTTTHKVRFSAYCEFAAQVRGNDGLTRTGVQFTRLGDT